MSSPSDAIRAVAAAIKNALPEASKSAEVDPATFDAELLARVAIGVWLAQQQSVPTAAAAGTAFDWNPDWPAPPGWHLEIYPDMPTDRATTRHDRMHAAARIIKD